MLNAARLALGQITDATFRRVLLRSLVIATALFAALWGGLVWLIARAEFSGIGWIDWTIDILGGAAALVGAIFLFVPATLLILPLFLNEVAQAVEARHYPNLPPARHSGLAEQLLAGLRLAGISVALNLLALPFVLLLPGVGVALYLAVNGWLLGREYFELAALRRVEPEKALALRRAQRLRVWAGGALVAAAGLVPFCNVLAPLFGAALFVHLFHRHSMLAGGRAGV
jgi:CysZ protein